MTWEMKNHSKNEPNVFKEGDVAARPGLMAAADVVRACISAGCDSV